MIPPLVLGTRGSALALAQVEEVKLALKAAGFDAPIEVKKITTSGDKRKDFTDVMSSGAGVKGLFTKEIEMALLDGSIGVAVHSCKDLPGRLAGGLAIGATLERQRTEDVYIGRESASSLPKGAQIGTSSVRRRRQLQWLYPNVSVAEMRGNVPTRLNKLRESPSLAGIVLARAGLNRLAIDLGGWRVEDLPLLPAAGQGAIALECRSDDAALLRILDTINHAPTFTCIRAERELLRLLDGDCDLPVGVHTELKGGRLSMEAVIFGAEGEAPFRDSVSGPAERPEEVAAALFEKSKS